jgi:hypothetical protein
VTADNDDSVARLQADNPRRPGAPRAVETARVLVHSPGISIAQKLSLAGMLVPVDSEAVAGFMARIVRDFETICVGSSQSNILMAGYSWAQLVELLFNVVGLLGKANPNAAVEIYSQLAKNENILADCRVRANVLMIGLESGQEIDIYGEEGVRRQVGGLLNGRALPPGDPW